MENSNYILRVNKLEIVYHHVSTAIQGVTFQICESQIFVILGANGAGKTSTLRAISGFIGSDHADITDGDIIFLDKSIKKIPPHKITKMGVVLVPERDKIFETLTTEENLIIPVTQNLNKKQMTEKVYSYFPRLYEKRHQLGAFLSGGERQMLAIGQALLCSPKLLLLDEVSLGLSPLIVAHLFETLLHIKAELNLTILLVEQNAAAALELADFAAIMENGRIVYDGTPQKLLKHTDVKEFYLGIKKDRKASYADVKQYRRSRRWWG
jgi:branched-chain amino acid transport system ATP-binding protein